MSSAKDISQASPLLGRYTTGWLFLIYWAVMALFFIRYPVNGSLPGNMDIWFYVWQMNDFITHLIGTAIPGDVLYPSTDFRGLVGSPYLVGMLYLPIKLIVGNDLWGFFFLVSGILALDATAFYLLAKRLKVTPWIAAIAGLLFAANNFTLSQVENFNAISFFPGLLSAWFLLGYFQKEQPSHGKWQLLASALLSGIQIYGSIYMFVFQFMLLGLIFLKHYKRAFSGYTAAWLLIIILLIIPFRQQRTEVPDYLHEESQYLPMKLSNAYHSIHYPMDLTRVHPGNILYPPMTDIENTWRYGARSAFLGYLFYIAVLMSVFLLWRKRAWERLGWPLALMIVAGLMAAGPIFTTPWFEFQMPMGWFNDRFPSSVLFRHVFRAYIYFILGGYLLVAMAASTWTAERRWKIAVAAVFAVVLLAENVPWKGPLYPSDELLTAPADVQAVLADIPSPSNIYFLPSCHVQSAESEMSGPRNPVSREYIYAAWKSQLPHNLYNGRMGYLTDLSNENSRNTCALDSVGYLELIARNDIDYLLVYTPFGTDDFSETTVPGLQRWSSEVAREGEAILFEVQ